MLEVMELCKSKNTVLKIAVQTSKKCAISCMGAKLKK